MEASGFIAPGDTPALRYAMVRATGAPPRQPEAVARPAAHLLRDDAAGHLTRTAAYVVESHEKDREQHLTLVDDDVVLTAIVPLGQGRSLSLAPGSRVELTGVPERVHGASAATARVERRPPLAARRRRRPRRRQSLGALANGPGRRRRAGARAARRPVAGGAPVAAAPDHRGPPGPQPRARGAPRPPARRADRARQRSDLHLGRHRHDHHLQPRRAADDRPPAAGRPRPPARRTGAADAGRPRRRPGDAIAARRGPAHLRGRAADARRQHPDRRDDDAAAARRRRRHPGRRPRHHAAQAGRDGAAAGQGSGRSGVARQERLRRQHQPRDPHADERHHRPVRAARSHDARRRAARLRRPAAAIRPVAAAAGQRRPRLLEDRSRPPRAGAGSLRPAVVVRRHHHLAAGPGARQGPDAAVVGGRAAAAHRHRRRRTAEAGARQPGRQLGQVQRARRPPPARRSRRAAGRLQGHRRHPPPRPGGVDQRSRLRAARHRAGSRHRHPGRQAGAHLRAVHAGRSVGDAPLRRHRPRPGDLGVDRPRHGRADLGRERSRTRQHVPLHRAADHDGARRRRPRWRGLARSRAVGDARRRGSALPAAPAGAASRRRPRSRRRWSP